MNEASTDAIIAEVERVFKLAGATDYDSGMAQCGRLLEWFQEHYHPMRSKEDLAALLNSMPEPSRLQMRFFQGTLKFAPHLIRHGFKRLATIAEGDLPAIPRGRPGLDAFSKEQIIAHVSKRHTAGYTLQQAKKAAARKFGVSESTVQRAWDDRGNSGEVDFRSVLKFLREDARGDGDVLDSRDGAMGKGPTARSA